MRQEAPEPWGGPVSSALGGRPSIRPLGMASRAVTDTRSRPDAAVHEVPWFVPALTVSTAWGPQEGSGCGTRKHRGRWTTLIGAMIEPEVGDGLGQQPTPIDDARELVANLRELDAEASWRAPAREAHRPNTFAAGQTEQKSRGCPSRAARPGGGWVAITRTAKAEGGAHGAGA